MFLNKLNIKSRHVYANTKIRFLRAWPKFRKEERRPVVQKNHGRIQTSVETMFHPFLIGSSPSSTPVFLSSFSPLLQPYLRARANFFFPFHFLPFHLLPRSFTLSPLLSFSFSFFFFFSIEFLFSLHSVVSNLRPSLDVSTRGLYCARLCPDNPLHSFKIVSRN